MDGQYDKAALEIVPVNCGNPSVVWLRQRIAAVIAREVARAIAAESDSRFPQVAERERKLAERAKLFVAKERALIAEKLAVTKVIDGCGALIDAVEGYMDWIQGVGEIDDLQPKWRAMAEAYRRYKQITK